jgi:hypothetical protein
MAEPGPPGFCMLSTDIGSGSAGAAAFVNLFAASAAPEAAITLDGALTPLRNDRRAAFHTPHPPLSLPEAAYIATQPRKTRSDWREG